MAFPAPSFLQVSDFTTHTAQRRIAGAPDAFGQTTISSVSTVSCIVYQLDLFPANTIPLGTGLESHLAIFSAATTILPDDHLRNATDPGGNIVLADARVSRVVTYHHPRQGNRAHLAYLEIPVA